MIGTEYVRLLEKWLETASAEMRQRIIAELEFTLGGYETPQETRLLLGV